MGAASNRSPHALSPPPAPFRPSQAAREMRDAARVTGDAELWALMEAVSAAVRRDVVFAASLYVT